MITNEQILILTLLNIRGVGKKKALNLIEGYNYEVDRIIYRAKAKYGEETYKFAESIAKKQLERNVEKNVEIITIFDKQFPKKFLKVREPIIYLFYKGNINLLAEKSLAIIGSRNVSHEVLEKSMFAGEAFAKRCIPIVSGLAIGVDTYAHKGTLQVKGKAIGVLPCDITNIAPIQSVGIAEQILKLGGCLVSEYGVGHKTDRFGFVKRDRIQSAIADTILVIEATEKSGTVHAVKEHLYMKKHIVQLESSNLSLVNEKITLDENSIEKLTTQIKNNEDRTTSEGVQLSFNIES